MDGDEQDAGADGESERAARVEGSGSVLERDRDDRGERREREVERYLDGAPKCEVD